MEVYRKELMRCHAEHHPWGKPTWPVETPAIKASQVDIPFDDWPQQECIKATKCGGEGDGGGMKECAENQPKSMKHGCCMSHPPGSLHWNGWVSQAGSGAGWPSHSHTCTHTGLPTDYSYMGCALASTETWLSCQDNQSYCSNIVRFIDTLSNYCSCESIDVY